MPLGGTVGGGEATLEHEAGIAMPSTMDIQGVEKIVRRLLKKAGVPVKPQVIVGYQATYAVFVHENLSAQHAPGKYAKFLERPAREFGKELGAIVVRAVKKGLTLAKALLLSGLRLQRESLKIVPVDTGFLKNSAFTEMRPLRLSALTARSVAPDMPRLAMLMKCRLASAPWSST